MNPQCTSNWDMLGSGVHTMLRLDGDMHLQINHSLVGLAAGEPAARLGHGWDALVHSLQLSSFMAASLRSSQQGQRCSCCLLPCPGCLQHISSLKHLMCALPVTPRWLAVNVRWTFGKALELDAAR